MTMFIKLENGLPVGHAVTEENLRLLFPNTLMPRIFTPENIQEYGFGIYEWTQIPTPNYPLKAIEITPVKAANGIWYQTWNIVEMSEEERTIATEQRTVAAKSLRELKLIRSDWTQLPDAPADAAAWRTYRQQLRDVTTQPGFPWEITWPQPPQQ